MLWTLQIEEQYGCLVALMPDGAFITQSKNVDAFKTYVLNAIACNIKPHEVVIG